MSDFWDLEVLVGRIEKNSREEIQIKKVEKKGKEYIDIRVFWLDSSNDEFKPSGKGVTIPYDNFKLFKDIINEIE